MVLNHLHCVSPCKEKGRGWEIEAGASAGRASTWYPGFWTLAQGTLPTNPFYNEEAQVGSARDKDSLPTC